MGKKVQVNFQLDKKLLEQIDDYCRKRNFNRSELIRYLIRKELDDSKFLRNE